MALSAPERLSDEALFERCADGDERALAELYDRYGRIAYGLALRVVRDPSLAEDVVQEAFLGAWRSAGAFSSERATPRTWILTLVHRRAVDLVRREERRRAGPLPEELNAAEDDAHEAAWLRARREAVRRALLRLPDEQREVLKLAYYGGFTQSELAARLGVPLGTVKSRTFSALQRLHELLLQSGSSIETVTSAEENALHLEAVVEDHELCRLPKA